MADRFKSCSVEGCKGNAHYSVQGRKGFCNSHYKRLWRHGNPTAGITANGEPLRFIKEVALQYEGDECLIWPFARAESGYGRLSVDGKLEVASRYVCGLVYGKPPTPKHEAAHSCGKGDSGCVTKGHLSWKTRQGNKDDELIHGTRNRGERQGNSKLSVSEVREIKAMKGREPARSLSVRFGVSLSHIWRIQNGKEWAWLTE